MTDNEHDGSTGREMTPAEIFVAKRESNDNQICEVVWYVEYSEASIGQRTRKELRDEIERRILRKPDTLDEITLDLWVIKDRDGCNVRTYKLTPIQPNPCNPGDNAL